LCEGDGTAFARKGKMTESRLKFHSCTIRFVASIQCLPEGITGKTVWTSIVTAEAVKPTRRSAAMAVTFADRYFSNG
jgi:hypothetical protein